MAAFSSFTRSRVREGCSVAALGCFSFTCSRSRGLDLEGCSAAFGGSAFTCTRGCQRVVFLFRSFDGERERELALELEL